MVTSTRHCVLAAFTSMLVIGGRKLHWDSFRLQSSTSTCANRLEDTDRVHGGRSSDSSHVRIVAIDKCAKSVIVPSLSHTIRR